jgi:hypothetical protein
VGLSELNGNSEASPFTEGVEGGVAGFAC